MAEPYAIIGSFSQAETCDIRDCDIRTAMANRHMSAAHPIQPEAVEIFERLAELGLSQRELAEALGIAENKISKVKKGERRLQASELIRAQAWLRSRDPESPRGVDPDLPNPDPDIEYVPIEVLPTYAGMGGGGTGDGDRQVALVPRALIVDILGGRPEDFLLINVRGDSMEPDFQHDDQLLIDRRDISPAQPGPFAVWDGEWGEYVVKNVERLSNNEVRIFSSNPKYSAATVQSDQTRIIGRPVWFGRKL